MMIHQEIIDNDFYDKWDEEILREYPIVEKLDLAETEKSFVTNELNRMIENINNESDNILASNIIRFIAIIQENNISEFTLQKIKILLDGFVGILLEKHTCIELISLYELVIGDLEKIVKNMSKNFEMTVEFKFYQIHIMGQNAKIKDLVKGYFVSTLELEIVFEPDLNIGTIVFYYKNYSCEFHNLEDIWPLLSSSIIKKLSYKVETDVFNLTFGEKLYTFTRNW